MTKEELLETLRSSKLAEKYYFVELGVDTTDVAIAMMSSTTKTLVLTFHYDWETDLIFRTIFVTNSFYEIKDVCDILGPIFSPDIYGEGEE